MMAELCFSVDDLILFFSSNFSNTAADTASEYDSCGHRRCWTAAASCPYCYCRRRAKPVGIVLPCVYCSRTRCWALWFVDDNGRALFLGLMILFCLYILFVFSKTAADTASEYDCYGQRRCWTAAASWPYYSCRRRAKPVGIVLPCAYCSRTRCCAPWFVDDDGRALFFG